MVLINNGVVFDIAFGCGDQAAQRNAKSSVHIKFAPLRRVEVPDIGDIVRGEVELNQGEGEGIGTYYRDNCLRKRLHRRGILNIVSPVRVKAKAAMRMWNVSPLAVSVGKLALFTPVMTGGRESDAAFEISGSGAAG